MLYLSKKLLKKIISELKIDKKEEVIFEKVLITSSESYLENQNKNKSRISLGKENEKLEQLENYLKKAKKAYTEISETNIFRFLSGLEKSKTKNKLEKEILLNLTHKNGIIYSNHIENILETLENSAKQAQKEDITFSKINKTQQVLFWLWGFSDEWEKYSLIKISF